MIVEKIKNVYLTKEEKNFIEKFWGFLVDNELTYDDNGWCCCKDNLPNDALCYMEENEDD